MALNSPETKTHSFAASLLKATPCRSHSAGVAGNIVIFFVIRIEEHLIDVADQGGVLGDLGRLFEVFEVTDQLAESGVVE